MLEQSVVDYVRIVQAMLVAFLVVVYIAKLTPYNRSAT